MGVLKVKNLTKDYGNNKGVFDVSFEIEEGEISKTRKNINR